MDSELQRYTRQALDRLQHVLDRGPDVQHAEIQAAVLSVIAFRNRTVQKHCEGAASDTSLRQANALVSLVYGAEFPLSGLHFNRIRQTCDGMGALLASAE